MTAGRLAATKMSPTDYEKAVVERFRTIFPALRYTVAHDTRLVGRKSGIRRQIDVQVSEVGKLRPLLIAEVKMHRRAVDLPKAGAAVGLIRDVGCPPAVVVSVSGFSVGASRYLAAEGVESMVITMEEAERLRWLPTLERYFRLDREFREVSGVLFEALRRGDADPFLDAELPYDEWLAVVACGWDLFPDATGAVLARLAHEHRDDGVRFNAIVALDENGRLDPDDARKALHNEPDPETRAFLQELLKG